MEFSAHLLSLIAAAAAATFLTRALPFVVLHRWADHPLIEFLGRFLPPVLMVLLVLYSLKPQLLEGTHLGPAALALALVCLLHWGLRNALVSILGGTGLYMFLLQQPWTIF